MIDNHKKVEALANIVLRQIKAENPDIEEIKDIVARIIDTEHDTRLAIGIIDDSGFMERGVGAKADEFTGITAGMFVNRIKDMVEAYREADDDYLKYFAPGSLTYDPEKIYIRIESAKRVAEDAAGISIGDLFIGFRYLVDNKTGASAVVSDTLIKKWNKTAEDIYKEVVVLLKKNDPAMMNSLGKLMSLTTRSMGCGAQTLLYPGMLDEIADRSGGSFAFMVSDCDAVTIRCIKGEPLCKVFNEMEFNLPAMMAAFPTRKASDKVYFYNADEKKIYMKDGKDFYPVGKVGKNGLAMPDKRGKRTKNMNDRSEL